jgi:transcriptional regulator with XRE-family HTH domain
MNELANPVRRRRRIGQRLRWWRRQRRLSQAELARRIGVTQSSLSHYESGKRDPALGVFIALVTALEVDPAEILKP